MPDQNTNQELSLDDIFSSGRKQSKVQQSGSGQPFKFLDSYTRKDKNIFFGRDSETDELFRKFYSGKLLLVYGKSGTGKSSVINCGLISRIPEEDIFAINIRCGKRAYNNFVCEIKKSSKSAQENPIDILEDIFYEHSKPVTLILDQFEEIFILSDEEERKKLAEALNEILKSRLQINVILIIREEYFASLTEFEPHIPGLYGNRIRIERMNKSAAKEAILKPCLACNVGIESGLADNLVEQLVWQSEGLELTWLQILMDKLYRIALKSDPENPVIKLEDLGKLGRIGNVLGDFLDEQLRSMPNADLGEALLKTMVSTDGTKKQISMKEISASLQAAGNSIDLKVLEDILRHLINVRIITEKDEQGYYELRHDAIAGRIYERMTAVEKEMIEIRAFLDNSYKIFLQRKVLLSENDLKYIELFESKLILNDKLKDFILASRKDVQKKRLRRRFITASAVTLIILVLSGFSLWAFIERTNAIKQTRLAEEQKNEAVRANSEAENAKIRAQEGENRAKKNETEAVEQQKIAEVQRQVAIKANREAENSRKQALEEKNRAVENEKLALTARQDAENAKNEVIKASSQAQFYLYLFNGKELANKSLLMQENDTLRALLALSGYDLISYGYEKFSGNQSSVKYDGEVFKALQNSLLLFQKDSVANGEIWADAFENNRIIFSNRIGQLSVAKLEDKSPDNLPVITLDTTINLQVNSLVRALSFDPLSNRLACGTIDGSVTLFENFDSDKQLQKIIYSHNNNQGAKSGICPRQKLADLFFNRQDHSYLGSFTAKNHQRTGSQWTGAEIHTCEFRTAFFHKFIRTDLSLAFK